MFIFIFPSPHLTLSPSSLSLVVPSRRSWRWVCCFFLSFHHLFILRLDFNFDLITSCQCPTLTTWLWMKIILDPGGCRISGGKHFNLPRRILLDTCSDPGCMCREFHILQFNQTSAVTNSCWHKKKLSQSSFILLNLEMHEWHHFMFVCVKQSDADRYSLMFYIPTSVTKTLCVCVDRSILKRSFYTKIFWSFLCYPKFFVIFVCVFLQRLQGGGIGWILHEEICQIIRRRAVSVFLRLMLTHLHDQI